MQAFKASEVARNSWQAFIACVTLMRYTYLRLFLFSNAAWCAISVQKLYNEAEAVLRFFKRGVNTQTGSEHISSLVETANGRFCLRQNLNSCVIRSYESGFLESSVLSYRNGSTHIQWCASDEGRMFRCPSEAYRNAMFPIPLLKLEIPDGVLCRKKGYITKNKHHPFDIGNHNVIELYMANNRFKTSKIMDDKYNLLLLPQMLLSIEYFATYTVKTDYAKRDNFIPKGNPELRGIWLSGLSEMSLYASVYSWPKMGEHLRNIRVTFLENEFAEEILLCTLLVYPKSYYLKGGCDSLRMGSANLNQLKFEEITDDNIMHIPYLPNSTVAETIRRGELNPSEALMLSVRAAKARENLYNALRNYELGCKNKLLSNGLI